MRYTSSIRSGQPSVYFTRDIISDKSAFWCKVLKSSIFSTAETVGGVSGSDVVLEDVLEAVASLGMVTPGADLNGVTRLAKAINYSTFKGWRLLEGISHFA